MLFWGSQAPKSPATRGIAILFTPSLDLCSTRNLGLSGSTWCLPRSVACAWKMGSTNPGRAPPGRGHQPVVTLEDRDPDFEVVKKLSLRNPPSFHDTGSGWWLGHPSEKYESQLG